MTKAQFDAAMPDEFWREVVDRVAAEVPDTLLLAEAFWLMEGYFVRTLGMHRVYNSAFMNMLRDEQNAKYRAVIRNTLEFDPEVLKRYVNFMNNPDEKTAVEQFGKGDKYFGVATLMATLPGLPMFGHGQIEGFAEKYGMEYRRAYWDERPTRGWSSATSARSSPLLRRRSLFAARRRLPALRLRRPTTGRSSEDVFAYSNRRGDERGLVVYHNRYGSASGRIRESVPFAERLGESVGAEKRLRRRTLADGLGLAVDDERFVILRDRRAGLESLRGTRELAEDGLRLDLGAYDCRVFLDFAEVVDSPGRPYGRLAAELGGRGVPSIEEAMQRILLRPVQDPVGRLLEPAAMEAWRSMAGRRAASADDEDARLRSDLAAQIADLFDAGAGFVGRDAVDPKATALVEARLAAGIRRLDLADLEDDVDLVALAAHLITTSLPLGLGQSPATEDGAAVRDWIDAWGLGAVIADAFRCAGLDEAGSWRAVDVVKALTVVRGGRSVPTGAEIVDAWRNDEAAAFAIGVNEHRGVRWFSKEAFDQAVRWWALAARAGGAPREGVGAMATQLREAATASGYRLDDLATLLEGKPIGAPASASATATSKDRAPR